MSIIISSFFAILTGLSPIYFKYWYEHKKAKEELASQKTLEITYVPIIRTFQNSLERQLFKNITSENIDNISSELRKLLQIIENDPQLFQFINEYFLYSLKLTVELSSQQEINYKLLNKNYQNFSSNYFFILNQSRHALGLPKRGITYRKMFQLYKEENLQKFILHKNIKEICTSILIALLIICFVLAFIISLLGLWINIVQLHNQLKS